MEINACKEALISAKLKCMTVFVQDLSFGFALSSNKVMWASTLQQQFDQGPRCVTLSRIHHQVMKDKYYSWKCMPIVLLLRCGAWSILIIIVVDLVKKNPKDWRVMIWSFHYSQQGACIQSLEGVAKMYEQKVQVHDEQFLFVVKELKTNALLRE